MSKAMLERILIPLDGSSSAESILSVMEPVLSSGGSELFLVRAIPFRSEILPAVREEQYREAESYLTGIANRLLERGVCTHALVRYGSPAQAIDSLASDEEITLIAMSSRGEDKEGSHKSSVLGRLLRGSSKPVVALGTAVSQPFESRESERKGDQRLLVPLDRREESRRSVPLAVELAESMHARIILMRVIKRSSERMDTIRDLQVVAGRLNERGVATEIRIESGRTAERILQACKTEKPALVVLTTRIESEDPAGPFGRVTDRLMRSAPVPVLAVRVRG